MRRNGTLAILASLTVCGTLAISSTGQDSAEAGEWPAHSARAQELGYTGGLTCALYVKDWEKSVTWYQEVLGFQMQYQMEEMTWAELFSPVANVTVGIGTKPEFPESMAGNATLVFGVNDIEKARKSLEAKGVKFTGATEVIPELVKLAEFNDPDGNTLTLFQSLQ